MGDSGTERGISHPEVARPSPSPLLLGLLVAMTAAAPIALQIYLPALPAIAKAFDVSAGTVQLSLSLSLLANAFATLAYGPLSDRFGRRPVLLVGLGLFLVGNLACALAPTVTTLIIARICQSAGAASGMVLARAIIRDLYDREQAASAIAYLTMVMVAAPMLSPTAGALLIEAYGWRAIFYTVGGFSVVLIWMVARHLVETHVPSREGTLGAALVDGTGSLLRNRRFLGYMLQSAFAIGTFFSFLAGAPYFMVDILGLTATDYGLWFILVSGAFMLGNFASARTVRRIGMHRLIVVGSVLSFASTVVALLLLGYGWWTPLALFGATAAAGFGNGLSIANSMAGAISVAPERAGAASGLCGFVQMTVSALVSQAVGMLQNGTPYPMAGFMVGCALLSLGCFVWAQRGPRLSD